MKLIKFVCSSDGFRKRNSANGKETSSKEEGHKEKGHKEKGHKEEGHKEKGRQKDHQEESRQEESQEAEVIQVLGSVVYSTSLRNRRAVDGTESKAEPRSEDFAEASRRGASFFGAD